MLDKLLPFFLATLMGLIINVPDSLAQSTPSTSGYTCEAKAFDSNGDSVVVGSGAGATVVTAAQQACPGGYSGGQCLPAPGEPAPGLNVSCMVAAVCLTGLGYEAADSNGFCPDPPPPDDDDGDDGDGDCEAGEADASDCNDGDDDDTDRDGDGDPDSSDSDDGYCYTDNCTSENCATFFDGEDNIDDDCEDSCSTTGEGSVKYFGTFYFPDGSFNIPAKLCDGECDWIPSPPLECYSDVVISEGGSDNYNCFYERNGDECTLCDTPSCQGSDCPSGFNKEPDGSCTEVENFCDVDDHTNGTEDGQPDGIPDNEDTFACSDDAEPDEDCDPETENCDFEEVGEQTCEFDELPECNGDPIFCALRESSYQERCGTNIENTFQCEEEFTCTGDTYECIDLELKRKQYCDLQLTQEQIDDEENLAVFREGVDNGAEYFGGNDVEGSIIDFTDFADDLDDTGYSFPRECISDFNFSHAGKSYTFEFSRICDYLFILRLIIMLGASWTSVLIIGRAF